MNFRFSLFQKHTWSYNSIGVSRPTGDKLYAEPKMTDDPFPQTLAYMCATCIMPTTLCKYYAQLRWRHNGRECVSNQQPRHCLLNRLFGRRSKKTSKLRVTGLCAGNSPGTGEFPAQMASNSEYVSISYKYNNFTYVIFLYTNRSIQYPQKLTEMLIEKSSAFPCSEYVNNKQTSLSNLGKLKWVSGSELLQWRHMSVKGPQFTVNSTDRSTACSG